MAKIPRVFQKIFAGSASNNGVFGTGQTGTKTLSNNLATLMGNAAFLTGWVDAVIGGSKLPPLEEFQALDYITTTQLAYLFQEGIAEYDSSTTYFTNSWVKKSGTNEIYGSLTDNNTGNALTDATKWELLADLSNLVSEDKLGSDRGVVQYTNQTATLDADDLNKLIVLGGTNTITLPLASASPAGTKLYFESQGGAQTINRQGSDAIEANFLGLSGSATTFPTTGYAYFILENYNGTDTWFLVYHSQYAIKGLNVQTFFGSGTYTPTTGMKYALVFLTGGGGGGAGVGASAGQAGGGGGAGAKSLVLLTAAQVGASQSVTIGNGGAGGVSASYIGSAGGTTSLGSLISVPGGSGGNPPPGGLGSNTFLGYGGAGGTAPTVSTGTALFNTNGESGSTGIGTNDGIQAMGGNGGGGWYSAGGQGGENAVGVVGINGGGGGGSATTSALARDGAAGGAGRVFIIEFLT